MNRLKLAMRARLPLSARPSKWARLILLPLLLATAPLTHAIGWQELKLSGRLLLGKMKITTSWSCAPSEQARAGLFQLADDALAPAGQVVRVILETNTLGNKRTNILWLDQSQDYVILQRERIRIKSRKPNYKVERYAARRMVRMERVPANRTEKRAPYQEWSSESLNHFEFEDMATGGVMTEPHALFFLLATSDIRAPGDTKTYRIYAGNRVLVMKFVAVAWANPDSSEVLIVTADATAPSQEPNAPPYKWFGMKGLITLGMATANRAIVSMAGHTKAGKINLSLKSSIDATGGVPCAANKRRPS